QRLKLAGHLAAAGGVASSTTHNGKLFLFDEPTTGLHFEDVAKLLRAFRKLLAAGHSLLVIEHNLDLIRASDWIIDLGPEGGDRGGEIVCTGTPAQVRENDRSYTGQALKVYEQALSQDAPLAAAIGKVSRESSLAQPDFSAFSARAGDSQSDDALGGGRSAAEVTGRASAEQRARAAQGRDLAAAKNSVIIHNAREHNL